MSRSAQLPLGKPIYSTYMNQGVIGAITANNPSIRNWYLNKVMQLVCNRKFMRGFTTPQIHIEGTGLGENPHFETKRYVCKTLGDETSTVIKDSIDNGYYVYFVGIDDYYMKGKCWYNERHFNHDGLICGYDQDKGTYSILAYDSRWIFRVIEIPQKCFEEARQSAEILGYKPGFYTCRVLDDEVALDPSQMVVKLNEYLDSSFDKYPPHTDGPVCGTVVQDYMAIYLDRLADGTIPYERIDRRVFRLIWEHKKIMLERIRAAEDKLKLPVDTSIQYEPLVKDADDMRMLYALYTYKKKDSILPTIKSMLLDLKNIEIGLLNEFVEKLEKEIKE